MLFDPSRALLTVGLQAGAVLGANTNTVADFDASLDFGSDADGFADNLVTDADGVLGLAPSGADGVNVTTADTRVGDFNVDIGLLERLGLELLPDHVALGGLLVETHPSFEFVVLCRGHGGR